MLSIIIIAKMVSANTALGGDGAKKLRRTVISILIVSIPVALTFALIFIMIAIEVSIHRHGDYYEYYITRKNIYSVSSSRFLMSYCFYHRVLGL